MKNLKSTVIVAVVCWFGGIMPAFAQGTAFTYQGRLDANGGPATGSYDLAFLVYDSTNLPGNVIAGPLTNSATGITNGLFTTVLDFGPGIFTGDDRWLEIAVQTNGGAGFTVLTPRQRIAPTPYAIMAGSASNLLGTLPTSKLTGTIPSANISGTYGNAVSFNNGADSFNGTFIGQFIGSSFLGGTFTGQFLGDGSALINLNASQLTSGTIPYPRLPANLAFVNSNQTFTAQNVFQQPVGFGNPTPIYAVDAMADQAVGEFISTNAQNGSVLVLRNNSTNFAQYLGAINFNDPYNSTPGQIGYLTPNQTNHNYDYMQFRVGGFTALQLQADPRGALTSSLIGGFPGNAVSTINSGGDVIVGGGFNGGANLIQSNSSGVFIGAGSVNQVGPNANDSLIVGGYNNTVQGSNAAIVGGKYNSIQTNSAYSFIGAGNQNTIASRYSFVGGGFNNLIQQDGGGNSIGGGYFNSISSNNLNEVIAGGEINSFDAYNSFSTIGGGYGNHIQGNYYNFANSYIIASTIAGGLDNTIGTNISLSTIGGGYGNTIQDSANLGTIGGGQANIIGTNASAATIGGGSFNQASGSGAVVPGGFNNVANGIQSFAAGTQAQATNDGSFVLADYHTTNFYSTTTNQFSARFSGGVRFETAGAGMTLDGQSILAGNSPKVVTLTNSANTFGGNGTGLTNVNAATLNGLSPSAFAPAASSTNYIQNQNLGIQTASFSINGNASVGGAVTAASLTVTNAQVTGLLRSGSESGTANPPSPAGLVIRHLNSLAAISTSVVARSDVLTLERDSSNEGLLIRFPAGVPRQTINCLAQSYYGTNVIVHTNLNNPGAAGTIQIVSGAQRAVHAQISFGNTFGPGHLTQVSIDRYDDGTTSDFYWVGTLISTFNQ